MKLRKQNNNGSISIVIPRHLLESLDWQAGQEIDIIQEGKSIRIVNLNVAKPNVPSNNLPYNALYNATALWCRLTNALIRRFKPLAETNPNKAIEEMAQIEEFLVQNKILHRVDLED